MGKIPLTAKLDSGEAVWQSCEVFSSSYFQIGQHVVLLHILMCRFLEVGVKCMACDVFSYLRSLHEFCFVKIPFREGRGKVVDANPIWNSEFYSEFPLDLSTHHSVSTYFVNCHLKEFCRAIAKYYNNKIENVSLENVSQRLGTPVQIH